MVYTDELYVHMTHSARCLHVKKKYDTINKAAWKGERLIILHATSDKGPLCERVEGIPVDYLDWKGDTPHPGIREDGKVTCETLRLANSKAGEYHVTMPQRGEGSMTNRPELLITWSRGGEQMQSPRSYR